MEQVKNRKLLFIGQSFYFVLLFFCFVIAPRGKASLTYPEPAAMALAVLLPPTVSFAACRRWGMRFFEFVFPLAIGVSVVYDTIYIYAGKVMGRTRFSVFYYMFFLLGTGLAMAVLLLERLYGTPSVADKRAFAVLFRRASVVLIPVFAGVLIFMFIINRKIGTYNPAEVFNLIPMQGTVKSFFEFFRMGYARIESFYVFFGNILFFSALSFYIMYCFPKTKRTAMILLPLLISFSIECSQYLLGTGNPDVDDFILNVGGFYLGWAFYQFLIKKDPDIFLTRTKNDPPPSGAL